MKFSTSKLMAVLSFGLLLATAPPLVGQQGPGGPGNGGGRPPTVGEDEGFGNNLAVPVVFTEGYGMLGWPALTDAGLRPRPGEVNYPVTPYWDPATMIGDYYPQQTANHWQADWAEGAGEALVVNWADNIVRQRWTSRSQIRVETVLYQNLAAENAMTAYNMAYMSGKGKTELWGTSGTTYESTYRTAYSVCARLKIEKLMEAPGGELVVDPSVEGFDAAVYEAFEGEEGAPTGTGSYSAEVNVSGNLIYGYNWALKNWNWVPEDKKLGWWRLTFSLDPLADYEVTPEVEEGEPEPAPVHYTVPCTATLAGVDPGDLEDEAIFQPSVTEDGTASVLEIEIVGNRKGGRKPAAPGAGLR